MREAVDTRASLRLRIGLHLALVALSVGAVMVDEGRMAVARRRADAMVQPSPGYVSLRFLEPEFGRPRESCFGPFRDEHEIVARLRDGGGLVLPSLPNALESVDDAFPLPGGRAVVVGSLRREDGSSAVLFRLGPRGVDWRFQPLLDSEIDGRWRARIAPGGRLELRGSFTSVRGQPRPGVAVLRSDGSLDD